MPQDLSARFTKSLAHIGKADFRDVFLDEMQAAESSVNLERYCDEGFPDPESIEFELDDVFQEAGVCSVRVSCTFTETVQTGCSRGVRPSGGGQI
jgi:hypothetical protein